VRQEIEMARYWWRDGLNAVVCYHLPQRRGVSCAESRSPDSGMITAVSAASLAHRELIVMLAARHQLPTFYAYRVFVNAGGLMTYGPDIATLYRRAADYMDRIRLKPDMLTPALRVLYLPKLFRPKTI
jgi:hypothetical protein